MKTMPQKPLKYLFVVQGEGRGHMTQAISLRELLTNAGHEVCCVLVGKSMRREIPSFFHDKIKCKVYSFESPNFIVDAKNKSVKIGPTIAYNLARAKYFLENLKEIDDKIKEYQPDVVINFYDFLCGLYFLWYKPKVKYICIGHQYLMLHPEFQFPKQKMFEKLLVQLNTQVTSFRADKKLALSFRSLSPHTKERITIVPPLLRKEIFNLSPLNKPFILAYVVNEGYSEEIILWHEKNSQVEVHCFWDKKDAPEELEVRPNLFFHRINDAKFLDLMKSCQGYACTAGFESVCEAMYLGKPVLMVPTEGHFEQECNALDAHTSDAGIYTSSFDLTSFMEFIPNYRGPVSEFRGWVQSADVIFLKELEEALK